jgi:hypothetical protein
MAAKARRSSYSRSSYEKHRKKRLAYARSYYKKHASKIKQYQKRYRKKTGVGTKRKPLYARGGKTGKRPLFARLPRLNAYRFLTRKKGKPSGALGRKAPSFRRGAGSNVGKRPAKGGTRAFRAA